MITPSDMRAHGNRLQKDLRDSTACNLDEWESLVKYIVWNLQLPVDQEPEYCEADVPRYDIAKMTLHFSSLTYLTQVFRHLTRSSLQSFAVKFKTRRSRKKSVTRHVRSGSAPGIEMVQLIGDCINDKDIFAFVLGGSFRGEAQSPGTSTLPILFRETMLWDDRDRMFEDNLELRMMGLPEVQSLYSENQKDHGAATLSPPPRKRGPSGNYRRRGRDTYFGLRWIPESEHAFKPTQFDSFNASEVNGALHICIPSTIFIGELYLRDLRRIFLDEGFNIFT